mmetsp:Transcript_95656/g.297810  ORF Transcript_95656/g.297810 Transcript_95656/m.297810 type:complete len:430 (-) Transcript_95656:87-1376(-)
MVHACGLNPEELRVRDGEYPPHENPLETAWTFWHDKKTSDRKESDQYMESLKQLGSFNTIEGFYKHYSYLLRPSEFPRDHNILLFRRGYKPMWEEFPEGGCWIVRIKRKVSMSYINCMWENLLLACIGEAFEMPDVVGCVLSTRLKDDVLSVWNLSNRDTPARFRIGEKLKEVLDLDMNALIQYKDHMQSLQDYSTYRNAKNYMFAPSPNATPQQGTMETPVQTHLEMPIDADLDQGMLPPAAIDEMLPPAAVDTGGFGGGGFGGSEGAWGSGAAQERSSQERTAAQRSPTMSAAASPWSPGGGPSKSPPLSAAAAPWNPPGATQPTVVAATSRGQSPALSPEASPWYPPQAAVATAAPEQQAEEQAPASAPDAEPTPARAGAEVEPGPPPAGAPAEPVRESPKSWAAVAAAAAAGGSKPRPKARPPNP